MFVVVVSNQTSDRTLSHKLPKCLSDQTYFISQVPYLFFLLCFPSLHSFFLLVGLFFQPDFHKPFLAHSIQLQQSLWCELSLSIKKNNTQILGMKSIRFYVLLFFDPSNSFLQYYFRLVRIFLNVKKSHKSLKITSEFK
jgi:hypothetical protein